MTRVSSGIDPELRDAYLRRLGAEPEPPSVDALVRLQQAHVERVPYETAWIHAGETWDIDPAASTRRIACQRRGGYCFHLNGAFSELLASLGYEVTRHVGGVHGPEGPNVDELTNHLVLTVSGLPTDDNGSGLWYVDAGMGDALHAPVPLQAHRFTQGPFDLALEQTADGVGDWHLVHDPLGTFTGMSWRMAPATLPDFAARHTVLSTSPDSGFVRIFTAQRRDATGVDIMRGLVLSRVGDGTAPGEPLLDRASWFAALADVFDLTLEGLGDEGRNRLWQRCLAAHEAWEVAGRP